MATDQTPSLEEIRARRAAITPGPWIADTREPWDMVVWAAPGTDPQPDDPENPRLVMNIGEPVVPVGDVCGSAADCQFIANAPSDIDYLLSLVEADERRIKDLEAAECTTGCCAVCGKPAKIIRGNVNDIVCTTIMRECRCNGSFNLWPTARPLATSTPSTEERAE